MALSVTQSEFVPPPPVQYNQPHSMHSVQSDLIFTNEWSHNLFDCCADCKHCCYAFFCLPCFSCKFDQAIKECTCTTLCFGAGSVMLNRAKLRGAYKIRGSLFEDCFITNMCCFCSMMQQWNEMKYRGDILE